MNKLSIVIVNYNVKYFLDQVLTSVESSMKQLSVEVWVVDNNSVDGSMEMVAQKFPWVKTIINRDNLGFSRANNQAIELSNSEYILLLNPDTVLQEDTLVKCVEYMDLNKDVGGLGVRMIDGKGNFLPESKRGLPTPKVAFFKMTGLASLFPKSHYFGRYHMKYLSEFETHEVEVLAGAFMMLRKSCLDKIGLLDEQFFMYGEDIDLSYRILTGGYKNVYYSDTTIIHYKGESTKKKSVNYVKVFYNAMILFAQKHYSQRMAGWFSFWIRLAIYLRATLAMVFRAASSILLPLADFIVVYLGYYGIAKYWELYHKFVPNFYPDSYYLLHIPVYVGVALVSIFISGGYDKPLNGYRIFRGAAAGSFLLFAAYGFLSKDLQFSRAILALGSAWAIGSVFLLRILLDALKFKGFKLMADSEMRVIIVAKETEAERISSLLNRSQVNHTVLGFVHPAEKNSDNFIGGFHQLPEIVEIYSANLVIFSGKDVAASSIMNTMSSFSTTEVQLKIAPDKSEFIIGSNSKNDPGELFTVEINYALAEIYNQRRKRIFDILWSVFILVFSPVFLILCFLRPSIFRLYKHVLSVLAGKKTWVSYTGLKSSSVLPKLKQGVIYSSGLWTNSKFEGDVNHLYAKEYSVSKDIQVMFGFLFNRRHNEI